MISLLLICALLFPPAGEAQPISVEAWQMQKLIATTEAELKSVRELLKASQQDSKSLDAAARDLGKLTAGLERSVAQFQGTKEYQDALLRLQTEAGADLKDSQRAERFRAESVRANRSDFDEIKKLSTALNTAEPGFVPKIAAEAQLGAWQSNARVSAQLTELIAELRALSKRNGAGGNGEVTGLGALIRGSEIQNQKQREAAARGLP